MVQQSSDLNDINDSRFKLISATFYHFFDAFPFGIGQGNYFGEWGLNSQFVKRYNIENT